MKGQTLILAFDKVMYLNHINNIFESGIQFGAYLQLVVYHMEDESEFYKIPCEGAIGKVEPPTHHPGGGDDFPCSFPLLAYNCLMPFVLEVGGSR